MQTKIEIDQPAIQRPAEYFALISTERQEGSAGELTTGRELINGNHTLLNSANRTPSIEKVNMNPDYGRSVSPDKMLSGSIVEDSIFKAGDSTLRLNKHNDSTMSSRFMKVVAENYSDRDLMTLKKYKEYAPKIELNRIVKARREQQMKNQGSTH